VHGTFYVVNSGNLSPATLNLGLSDGTDFHLSATTGIPAGSLKTNSINTTFQPMSTGPLSSTVTMTSTTGLTGICQSALPAPITITGVGQP
jgi:hypothetical protein